MRIGFVTTWFERGAAYVTKQYINVLKDGNDIFIYARGGESHAKGDKNWDTENVTWGNLKWGREKNFKKKEESLEHFKKWILDKKLEVVFFNEEHWWVSVIICNNLGIKTGSYIDYYTKETFSFFQLYDFLICNTKKHFSVFSWHSQVYYIPWGTDVNVFRPKSFDLVEKGKVTFFHSAGMNPKRKGTDILIRAFFKMRDENAKLIIHSQNSLKKFFPSLSETIKKLEDEGFLLYIEKTVSAPGLYYMGDVYVYPTILEGIGLTITEALSSGLPVITSDNAPMNEFINSENGKLVKIKRFYKRDDGYYWPLCEVDEKSLIDSMEYFCKNLEEVPILKKKAREYAKNNFDWAKNSLPLTDIFSKTKIITRAEKEEVKKIVLKYENIKKSKIKNFIHKIKLFKWRFIPFIFKKIFKK